MPDNAAAIGAFLDKFWEQETGKVYVATLEGGVRKSFKQYLVNWPLDRQKLITTVLHLSGIGQDVFFCPSVFLPDAPKPERAYVKSVNSYWLDFDGNAPENWEVAAKEKLVPEPSFAVQSSMEGQQHVYWMTERVSGPELLDAHETITRNLTAAFGSDKAGWDLPQLLRIPGTYNYGFKPSIEGGEHKPWYKGEPVEAKILFDKQTLVLPAHFSSLTQAEKQILSRLNIVTVPPIREVMAFGKWTTEMFGLFNATAEQASESSPFKRSGALQKLAYFGAENGFNDEQIYAILEDADRRWEKYTDRSAQSRDKALKDCIARARDKLGYAIGEDMTLAGIMAHVTPTQAAPQIVFSYSEFLAAEFHVDWQLDGLMPVGGFGLVVGQPGVGKTRLGLQIGLELAAGREQIVAWPNKTGPKKVAMFSLEMSGNTMSLFMKAFHESYEKDELALDRNFYILPIGSDLPLDRIEGQTVIDNFLKEYKPDILFIDSLQKSMSKPMTDEIAMKSLTKFIQEIRKRYNTSVYFVHHQRKRTADQSGGFSASSLSDVFGSQMLLADVDFVVSLDKSGSYTVLNEPKNRLAQAKENVHLRSDGIRFVLSDEEIEFSTEHYGNGSKGDPDGPSFFF